jgi:hypothetical protein
LTVRAAIKRGKYRDLRKILDDGKYNPFQQPTQGVHYARLFTTDERSLFFMVIYDEYEQALCFLNDNAEGVDRIFQCCEGYPEAGAADYEALKAYVWNNKICVQLFYRAYGDTQPVVRDALTLRQNFLSFIRNADGVSGPELQRLYSLFCSDPQLLSLIPPEQRKRQQIPEQHAATSSELVQMEPIIGKGRVNPFTLLARVRDDKLRKIQRTLQLGTFATVDLGLRPLENLSTLHFARVSIINNNQMLFASVYDGDFFQYIEDFGTRIASEIDQVFGVCVGYPMAGSRDVGQFKTFLQSHQLTTNAFGGSYLQHTLLEIQASLALSRQLERFRRRVKSSDSRLRAKLDRFLHTNQLLLS